MSNSISRKEIENLLPHREPMLLIDELVDINVDDIENYDKEIAEQLITKYLPKIMSE